MEAQAAPRPSALREVHLRDYWKIVWQGRWTLLAIFCLVVGVTAIWTFLQQPIYRATVLVEVQPQARRLLLSQDVSGMGATGYSWLAEEKYHNTQIEILKSRDVSKRVVRLLDLGSHPRFRGLPDPVDAFRRQIRVEPRRDTALLELSMEGQNPNEITQWINAVAQAYVNRNFEQAHDNLKRSAQAIQEQMDNLKQRLSQVEERRLDTLRETQIYDAENQKEILRDKLKAYNEQLTEVRIEAQQLESTLGQIRQLQARKAELLSLPDFAADSTLQSLMHRKTELQQELEKARVDLKPDHPEVGKIKGQMRTVENDIDAQLKVLITSLELRYDRARAKDAALEEQIKNADLDSLHVASATSKYDTVKTEAATTRGIVDVINKTTQEVALSAELLNNNVSVVDEANPPLYPVKPRKSVNLALGAVMGMFFGLGLVFFLDYLDNTIRTPEDVEKFLGLSVLGVIPKMQDEQGLAHRAMREAFQSLRTSVIFSSKSRQHKVLLITSTGPREGKSSTVANLGRVLAAASDRVIVVDCDLRKPKQHVHYGLEREPGLTNYLAGRAEEQDWSRYVRSVQPNLDVLPCGLVPPSPPELLGSDRFRELLGSLRERYDWVLLDSPPAANLADASLLASLAEMIVLVVRHNATDRDHVVKTYRLLHGVNASVAGVVLNSVDLERAYHKDYYYAGYYYQDEEGRERPRKRGVERKAGVG